VPWSGRETDTHLHGVPPAPCSFCDTQGRRGNALSRLWHFRDWALSAKIAALLAAAAVLPLSVVTLMDAQQARDGSFEHAAELLAARCDHLAAQIDGFNAAYLDGAVRFAALPDVTAFVALPPQERAPLKPALRNTLGVWARWNTHVLAVAVLDSAGAVTGSTIPAQEGVSYGQVESVKTTLQTGVASVDVFAGGAEVQRVPVVAFLAPVFGHARQPQGLLMLLVESAELGRIARPANELAGPGSFAVLLSQDGIRLAHTFSSDMEFHPTGPVEPAAAASWIATKRFGDNTAQLLQEVLPFPELFERARVQVPDQSVFRGIAPSNHVMNYGVGRRLKSAPWTLFYMVPETSLLAKPISTTKARAAQRGLIIVLAMLIAWFITRQITAPVAMLTAAADAVAAGNRSGRINPCARATHPSVGRSTAPRSSGWKASFAFNSNGKLTTHCRYGTWGSTWSTRCAAPSAMARPEHDGHIPRRLQLNATMSSWPQNAQ